MSAQLLQRGGAGRVRPMGAQRTPPALPQERRRRGLAERSPRRGRASACAPPFSSNPHLRTTRGRRAPRRSLGVRAGPPAASRSETASRSSLPACTAAISRTRERRAGTVRARYLPEPRALLFRGFLRVAVEELLDVGPALLDRLRRRPRDSERDLTRQAFASGGADPSQASTRRVSASPPISPRSGVRRARTSDVIASSSRSFVDSPSRSGASVIGRLPSAQGRDPARGDRGRLRPERRAAGSSYPPESRPPRPAGAPTTRARRSPRHRRGRVPNLCGRTPRCDPRLGTNERAPSPNEARDGRPRAAGRRLGSGSYIRSLRAAAALRGAGG